MAFASVGSLGTMAEKATNDTGVISPTSDVPVGNLIGVWVAWQSHYFFGPDGPQNLHHGCIDSVGNIYSTLISWYVFGPAYVGLFLTEVTTPLTTTDTITVTWQGTGSGVGQTKAISLWEFSKDPSKRWAYVRDRTVGGGVVNGDPPSITISSLPAGHEFLLLHSLDSYGPNTDSFTWDSDYTQITGAGTTGGADNSNVTLRGGFRIATVTSDTVDVTNTTATRTVDNALGAIMEIDEEPFPSCVVLDTFNRANEDPLATATPPANGSWITTGDAPGFGTSRLRVVSNVAAKSPTGTGEGSQWWDETVTDEFCAEIFATLATRGHMDLYWLGSGSGQLATLSSFIVAFETRLASSAGARMAQGNAGNAGGISSQTVISSWYDMQSGDKIGGQWVSPVMHLWLDRGSGWEWVSADYRTNMALVFDDGKFGMSAQGDSVTRLDDFGWCVGCFIPQFYRRPFG